MKYFSAEEARRIMDGAPVGLIMSCDENPNREAVEALLDRARTGKAGPLSMALYGFALGHAAGIREERARRKEREGRT